MEKVFEFFTTSHQVPTSHATNIAYEGTNESSPMRRFLVDVYNRSSLHGFPLKATKFFNLDLDFVDALVAALVRTRSKRLTPLNVTDYYVDQDEGGLSSGDRKVAKEPTEPSTSKKRPAE